MCDASDSNYAWCAEEAGRLAAEVGGGGVDAVPPRLLADLADAISSAAGPSPAVAETVFDGYLVCMEDGGRFECLARHVERCHGMAFAEYLERWGLPSSHPSVSASYSRRRSEIALAAHRRNLSAQ